MFSKIAGLIFTFAFLLLPFYFLLFTLITPAFAQTPSNPSSNLQLPTSISPTSPLYTDLLVYNIFHTFSCLGVGQSVIGQPCLNYVKGVPVLSSVNMSGGTLGAVTGLIGGLYANPPVRTSEALASLGENLGLVKQAHAQGVVGSGANVLSPIISLWQVSRNISYVIMIVIFVIIGLMVMFRQRINPQTVITAQAAIPGLVIGLILITFSYFLAGLISDTAFLGTNLVGAYFSAVKGQPSENLVEKIAPESAISIFSPFVGIVTNDKASAALDSIMNKLSRDVQDKLRLVAGFLGAQFISPLAGGIPGPWGLVAAPAISFITGLAVGGAPTFFLGFLLSFIATFALIWQMLQLLLRLIRSYLTIVFMTIAAPFQFLFASLPGRQGLATDWIQNMLGNILVFPAVVAVLYFVAFLLGPANPANSIFQVSDVQLNRNDLVSPVYAQDGIKVVGSTTFPLLGGLDLDFVKILLAFGALMVLPAIPDLVVRTVGKVGQAGQILGQELSGGIKSGQGYYNQFSGAVTQDIGGLKRGIYGQSGYRYEPGVGMVWGKVQPGARDLERGGSWNPFRWKIK